MLALVLTSNAYPSQPSRLPRSWLTRSRLMSPEPGRSRLRQSTRAAAIVMGPVEPDETWTTTPSGLKYLDVTVGDGETPTSGAVVGVDYTGWTMAQRAIPFDSSQGRGGALDRPCPPA